MSMKAVKAAMDAVEKSTEHALLVEAAQRVNSTKQEMRIEALEATIKSMLHFNGDCACAACVAAHDVLRKGQ